MRERITPDYLRQRAATVRGFAEQKLGADDPDLATMLLRLADELEATADELERDSGTTPARSWMRRTS